LLNNVWRLGVLTVGLTVLLAGIVMLVLPGPGWAAIFIGIAILATEFAWAQYVLRWAKRTAVNARDRVLDPRVRRRNQILAVLIGLLVAVAIIAYLTTVGPNLP
jgi:uncharacterized protein (TIGR02611 family)